MDRVNPKNGKLLYHLTALENLPSIIENGLQARKYLNDFIDVADKEIIEHRQEYDLNKYVPFHFYAPTPFAGAVQTNYPGKDFIYLTIKRDIAIKNDFKIIPRHPLSFKSGPLDYSEGIKSIEWEIMEERDYQNKNCSHICMAECITNKKIPFRAFCQIFVKNSDAKQKVERLTNNVEKQPKFTILTNEYFFIK